MIEIVKYKTLDGKVKRVFIIGKESAVKKILDVFYRSFDYR